MDYPTIDRSMIPPYDDIYDEHCTRPICTRYGSSQSPAAENTTCSVHNFYKPPHQANLCEHFCQKDTNCRIKKKHLWANLCFGCGIFFSCIAGPDFLALAKKSDVQPCAGTKATTEIVAKLNHDNNNKNDNDNNDNNDN